MEPLERLLMDVKESLERQIGALDRKIDAMERTLVERLDHLSTRFDTQAVRLDRHAGLWQAGTRWSSRMDAWAEKIDGALEAKDREIAELRERINKLEKKSP